MPFELLAAIFGNISHALCADIFWDLTFHHFSFGNMIPKFWSKDDATEEEKDQMFDRIRAMMDPFYQHLADQFVDPKGTLFFARTILSNAIYIFTEKEEGGERRRAIMVAIDSTKIRVQKSSDSEMQKLLFNWKQNSKHIKSINHFKLSINNI